MRKDVSRDIREYSCEGKCKFGSMRAAVRFLRLKNLKDMHAYFCKHCKGVHVGH